MRNLKAQKEILEKLQIKKSRGNSQTVVLFRVRRTLEKTNMQSYVSTYKYSCCAIMKNCVPKFHSINILLHYLLLDRDAPGSLEALVINVKHW